MRPAIVIVLVFTGFLAACPPGPPAVVPPPPEMATCVQACNRQRDLGCELGETTEGGFTCEDVCENTAERSPSFAWDTTCLAAAISCEDCEEGDWEDSRW